MSHLTHQLSADQPDAVGPASTDHGEHAKPHPLVCMEIWGGNRSIDNALSAPGIDAWVYSHPHEGQREGGDIHYVSMCGAGNIARFMIADVSGHGELVGAVARDLRELMRKNINTLDNARFTRALNESFQSEQTGGLFATAILSTYFAPTDELIVVNAGHPAPLHYIAKERRWRILTPDSQMSRAEATNLPLGVIEPTDFVQFAVRLGLDDLVLLYTDGLIEAKDSSGAPLGEQGLLRLLSQLSVDVPEKLISGLLERIVQGQQGTPIDDDVTAVLLHHNASDPPRQSVLEQLSALAKSIGLIKV